MRDFFVLRVIAKLLIPFMLLTGMMLQAGFTLVTVKLIIIGLLILFTSPTATHALCKAALMRDLKPLLADGEATSKP